MLRLLDRIRARLARDQRGAAFAEYAIVLALVAVALAAALGQLGDVVRSKFNVDLTSAVSGDDGSGGGSTAEGKKGDKGHKGNKGEKGKKGKGGKKG